MAIGITPPLLCAKNIYGGRAVDTARSSNRGLFITNELSGSYRHIVMPYMIIAENDGQECKNLDV